MMSTRLLPLLATSALLTAATASAFNVLVTIENLAPDSPTGLYLTPVWTGFHDGTFDAFDAGSAASSAIEPLAELGDGSALTSLFAGSVTGGVSGTIMETDGFNGAVFAPGTSESMMFDLDSMSNAYLSIGAMVVPSNDMFIGFDDPMAAQIFDGSGNFLGGSWTLTVADVWDAGTEVDDLSTTGGAAFVNGADAMVGATEGGLVSLQSAGSLSDIIGVMTPIGSTIGTVSGDLVRITVTAVPEPSTLGLVLGLGALLALVRRRR